MPPSPTLDANGDGAVSTAEAVTYARHWAVHAAGSLLTAYLLAAQYGLVSPLSEVAPGACPPCPVAAPAEPAPAPAAASVIDPAPDTDAETDAALTGPQG